MSQFPSGALGSPGGSPSKTGYPPNLQGCSNVGVYSQMSANPGEYPPNPGGYLPNPGGYLPNSGELQQNVGPYPQSTPGYPQNADGYPPNMGGYPPNAGGYPPNAGSYLPNVGVYPANVSGYQPNTGGYPPITGGYPPNAGFPPNLGFPPNAGFPPNSGFPPNAGYPPTVVGSYPPNKPYPYAQSPQDFQRQSPNQEPSQDGFPPTDKLQLDGEPVAPPLHELLNPPGYEGLTFDSSALKPPTYEEAVAPPISDISREIFQNAPSLTEDEAREAVLGYVSHHCCYGSKAAKQMTIKDIRFNSAIHYKLETYGEKRETAWVFEPFKGQNISFLNMEYSGNAPGPWEVNVPSGKENFCDVVKETEVPNTTNIRPCHKCHAMGRLRCKQCFGKGRKRCTWCHGRGKRTHLDKTDRCTPCNGTGRTRCLRCRGSGHVTCDVCKGECELRYFIKLTVTWKNHVEDHISDTAELPKDLIRSVSGQTAIEDEKPRVWPICNFPDAAVNAASQTLVEKHRTAFPQERILMQRQQVRIVPIADVEYFWKRKEGKFFVYGFEKEVHFPNYPQSCCWGCQII